MHRTHRSDEPRNAGRVARSRIRVIPQSNLSGGLPLFILSFGQRDELAASAAAAGWQVVAARRAAGAERRFVMSGAAVAVIDARDALPGALDAVGALADSVEAAGAAMLVLVSPGDPETIARIYAAGATHFLAGPASEAEFIQSLRFCARHADRLAGEWRTGGASGGSGSALGWPLGWRYDLASRKIVLTPALAELLHDGSDSVRKLLRRIDGADRAAAFAALRRLSAERTTTAFAHALGDNGRAVEHLQFDPARRRIDALVELLGSAPEPAAELHDALAGARDAASARRWISARLDEGAGTATPPLVAMLVALNRFEIVNTAYGRAVGNALLRAAHKRIEEAVLGETDAAIVTRVGGSSFLIALAASPGTIEAIGRHVVERLSRAFLAGEAIVVLGCRIGLAEAAAGDDAASLLRRASEALADARESDSATVRIAERGEAEAPLDRLAADLHHAVERGEIDILFQPQVATATGIIVGVEALARWRHPLLGEVGAANLFAAATRADLEIALSDHIQRLVLDRASAWPPAMRFLRLSLNLTAGDIARPGFAAMFLARVDQSGFPRARLTLEITESGLIDDLGVAAALLAVLRSAGCRIAIDDFGTGYSSLAYLKSLPLDYLKIDKKLAQDITGTTRDRVVVRGVIDMARSLGLAVIAEGVETDEQLELLRAEGCQIYQGFLCSEPIGSDALAALMEGR